MAYAPDRFPQRCTDHCLKDLCCIIIIIIIIYHHHFSSSSSSSSKRGFPTTGLTPFVRSSIPSLALHTLPCAVASLALRTAAKLAMAGAWADRWLG